ncbi:hypothetical protein CTKZ_18240 [Cellulomonas algicola]|uniref:Uncharacterized protein n=1 Tax=Cellulomonas algicola TaxID=2071633 RepID=A0A401V027_9CELL|nr:hypothetical protein [Cellulomonas algicola]GCD20262.1 hypothetical protein CTKZ_18240 [Cellulomonas algicola]
MTQSRAHRPSGGPLDHDVTDTSVRGSSARAVEPGGPGAAAIGATVVPTGPAPTRRAVTALQRSAGNRAVAGLLDRSRPPAGLSGVQDVDHRHDDRDRSDQQPVDHRHADLRRAGGRRDDGRPDRRGPARAAPPHRFSTTDSTVANVASVFGATARGGAASMMGAVTFDSSAFAAAVARPLAVTKTGTDVNLSSATYAASGTVRASGPAARVGQYEIGFLQTVYESSRNFYYEPAGHTPGLLARIAPTFFGERKKVSDTCSSLPVRDGDAGFRPWYGPETVFPFSATDPSTKNTAMQDTPDSTQPWTVGSGTARQQLVKTDGRDRFRSWLAVKDTASTNAIMLNYADWLVDYGTTVTFNSASPAASVVTPTATSGARVTGTGDGTGGQWPLHGDPVANDVATVVESSW